MCFYLDNFKPRMKHSQVFILYTDIAQTNSWIRFESFAEYCAWNNSKLCSGRVKLLTNDIEDFLLLIISGEKNLWRNHKILDILGENSTLEFFNFKILWKLLILFLQNRFHSWRRTLWFVINEKLYLSNILKQLFSDLVALV